jgi:hypothetical protein
MLALSDVLDPAAYAQARPRLLREILEVKAVRRLAVGPVLTLLFENRATCLWQVQEMCRVEHITDPKAVQHELDTYNELLPRRDSLSATLLVEVTDPDERAATLRRLVGLHEHVALKLDGDGIRARFDANQFEEARISSVQFVRFPITEAQIRALGDLARPAEIVVDHPAYAAVVALPLTLRAALVEDLPR